MGRPRRSAAAHPVPGHGDSVSGRKIETDRPCAVFSGSASARIGVGVSRITVRSRPCASSARSMARSVSPGDRHPIRDPAGSPHRACAARNPAIGPAQDFPLEENDGGRDHRAASVRSRRSGLPGRSRQRVSQLLKAERRLSGPPGQWPHPVLERDRGTLGASRLPRRRRLSTIMRDRRVAITVE